ncbi:MAG: FtsW/RodA/SpoVE family cell cycle protein [Clostridiaceae bacterium]|jgi:cell division protein FtsW|nr:FtsW/RodA/SpoVE family cell cycle protein [Clostridiaceae bacterium]
MRREQLIESAAYRNRDVRHVTNSVSPLPSPRRIHGGLLIVMLIMACFGLIMLFSASMSGSFDQEGDAMYVVFRQAGITAMGLAVALILAVAIPLKLFDHFWMSAILYVITSGLLVYVKLFGVVINSARRWIRIPVFGTFQPSELAKLAMVFCFAGYVSMVRRRRAKGKCRFKTKLGQFLADGWIDILFPFLAFLVWLGLILWQPHLSATLILGFVMLAMFLAAGIRLRSWISAITQMVLILVIIALLVGVALPALKAKGFEETIEKNFAHVEKRLDTFLNPESASADDTYQIDQSVIAMGSGGLSGVGLGSGRQKYNYLPEPYNDFIFAVIGEELGFIGTLSVILLFVLFLLMGVGITYRAPNAFGAVLAGGYTMLISIQAFLNIAVATKTIPATGISLPLFSYGGTSNLFFLLAIGFILAVSKTGRLQGQELAERSPSATARRTGGRP